MSDLHVMPGTNITHSACRYTGKLGVIKRQRSFTYHTWQHSTAYMHICLQGIDCLFIKNYPPELMQPSSSTRATIVIGENQNGATIFKVTFFFCHY